MHLQGLIPNSHPARASSPWSSGSEHHDEVPTLRYRPNRDAIDRPARLEKAALLGAVALGAVAGPGFLKTAYFPSHALAQAQVEGAERPSPPASAQAIPSFADVVDRVKPAVVSVRVKTPARQARATGPGGGFDLPDFDLPQDHPFQEFFRRFRGDRFGDRGFGDNDDEPRGPRPGPGPRRFGQSQGSGFFISTDGYLVTNNHVIDKSSEVQVLTDEAARWTPRSSAPIRRPTSPC